MISIVAAAIVTASIATAALVVATAHLVLLLLVFLHNGSKDLSVQDLLMSVPEVLVVWGVLPVSFALPITKPVSLTQRVPGSSNIGGDYAIVLLHAVNGEVLLVSAAKAISPLGLVNGWARGVLLEGLLGPARVGHSGLLGHATSGNRHNKNWPHR